ncbi:hypothetical protein HUO09_17220 [Vibrio sp. Y2-5]|uniref:hypothetical protein n=1 Tax=Vibrio sp. Y2-5 TaxID=2743977 RepID=UPI0016608EC8|nr:hypothetical protein [Vibrio sp. Y2-5]MBD0788097.1 hypothetical protein [Vibrio sp. Y2-5]
MQIQDWTPPPCPKCGADEMLHMLVSHIPTTKAFRTQNGWYCGKCNAGAFQLGNFSESDAAQLAVSLVNR